MADAPGAAARGAALDDRRRRGSCCRPTCHVQAPPNLSSSDFAALLDAGIDDWGGVSPVTIDHVNPEAPWPELEQLRAATEARGLELAPRLPVYPEFLDAALARRRRVLAARRCGSPTRVGLAREDGWCAGRAETPVPFVARATRCPRRHRATSSARTRSCACFARARRGAAARARRRRPAAARGQRRRGQLRRHAERPIHERLLLPLRLLRLLEGQARREPARRAVPRPARGDRPPGARGVGARRDRDLPAGRHPPGLRRRLLRSGRARRSRTRVPDLHVHAFSRARGLAGRGDARRAARRLPGAAARRGPRVAAGHRRRDPRRRGARGPLPGQGHDRAVARGARGGARGRACARTTTIMFGHVDGAAELGAAPARACASCSSATGGFTEFVPLPFVHMEAPIYLRRPRAPRADVPARRCSCTRSAGSRCIRWITNIQASWVKLGPARRTARRCAPACNDLGGTLMNESISRAAGASTARSCRPSGWSGRSAPPGACRASGRRSTATPRPAQRRRLVRRRAARRAGATRR